MTNDISTVSSDAKSIRLPQVCALVGVSRATIWRLVQADPTFPRPFKITPAVTVWNEQAVARWLEKKQAA